jgi:hypothetical protein
MRLQGRPDEQIGPVFKSSSDNRNFQIACLWVFIVQARHNTALGMKAVLVVTRRS